MKHLQLLVLAMLTGIAAQASAETSASIMLTSDYVFRGISNSDGDPAIQGSFDYEHDSGFYVGAWASSVKFRENADVAAIDTVDEASIEIDYYAGLAGEFDNAVSWDASLLYYSYPGAQADLEYDYWEAMGALAYVYEDAAMQPEVAVEAYYSPEYFGQGGDASYYSASVYLNLPQEYGLSFSAGRQQFDDDPDSDYTDYRIAISRSLAGFDFELAWSDTSLSKPDCDDEEICSSRVVFAIAKSLD